MSVRWSLDALGRDRVWYSLDEIESIMEDELHKADLLVTTDRPVTELEPFLERHLGVRLDQYAALPPDVLGQTIFEPGEPVRVEINEDLTGAWDEGGSLTSVGRWRATLAHEAAHVLLHRILFEVPLEQETLFGNETETRGATMMRCLKRDVSPGRRAADWREFQANQGMAALLMPRKIFGHIARQQTERMLLTALPISDAGSEDILTRKLAGTFDVSRQAAGIRLRTLGFVTASDSDPLLLTSEL